MTPPWVKPGDSVRVPRGTQIFHHESIGRLRNEKDWPRVRYTISTRDRVVKVTYVGGMFVEWGKSKPRWCDRRQVEVVS